MCLDIYDSATDNMEQSAHKTLLNIGVLRSAAEWVRSRVYVDPASRVYVHCVAGQNR